MNSDELPFKGQFKKQGIDKHFESEFKILTTQRELNGSRSSPATDRKLAIEDPLII
jgi:hypothetical protein